MLHLPSTKEFVPPMCFTLSFLEVSSLALSSEATHARRCSVESGMLCTHLWDMIGCCNSFGMQIPPMMLAMLWGSLFCFVCFIIFCLFFILGHFLYCTPPIVCSVSRCRSMKCTCLCVKGHELCSVKDFLRQSDYQWLDMWAPTRPFDRGLVYIASP